jgi:hypothetical protein
VFSSGLVFPFCLLFFNGLEPIFWPCLIRFRHGLNVRTARQSTRSFGLKLPANRPLIAKLRACPAMDPCTAVKARFCSNISWSSVQSGALANSKSEPRPNQRKREASTARSIAAQDLATLSLAGLRRITEPNGVREFSSIWTSTARFPCPIQAITNRVGALFNS